MVYDVTHSVLLYSQNADAQCSPASLTKLVTAMVASDACGADEVFTAGTELSLVQSNSSRAGIQKGYKLTREQIIDALLLPSGNDAAYTIAAHVGRKISGDSSASDLEAILAFVDKMNEKAKELGAAGTHFSNPDGYYAADHYTTASDMLKFAKAALQYDNLKKAMATVKTEIKLVSGQSMTLKNTNVIINPSSPYYFQGATGMKTGFTDQAGNCVVASASRNGVDMIVVVMGGATEDVRWKDATEMLKEAYALETASAGTTGVNTQ
jgi:D-alanyl-D-alanine carboxypeptidase (penicillin-binding protein 5/6)